MVTADTNTATRRRAMVLVALIGLVGGLAVVSLGVGPVKLSPATVIDALFGGGSEVQRIIVQQIRLPRAILGLGIGAILGLSGAALQGLLRNPLASPSLFGAPQAAAFGAVLVIALGWADVRSFALPSAAIVAAFASVFVLLAIAGRNAGLLLLILAGLAISSLAGAATSLTMNVSRNPFAALEIAFWLLGSLEDRSFRHVTLALPFIVVGAAILLSQRHAFRALSIGEETAQSLGVHVGRLRLLVILGVALGVGGAVAVAGDINALRTDTSSRVVGITEDGGNTWRLVPRPSQPGALVGAAWVPANGDRIIVVASYGGASYSTDAGQSWTRITDQVTTSVATVGRTAVLVGGGGRIWRIEF